MWAPHVDRLWPPEEAGGDTEAAASAKAEEKPRTTSGVAKVSDRAAGRDTLPKVRDFFPSHWLLGRGESLG